MLNLAACLLIMIFLYNIYYILFAKKWVCSKLAIASGSNFLYCSSPPNINIQLGAVLQAF